MNNEVYIDLMDYLMDSSRFGFNKYSDDVEVMEMLLELDENVVDRLVDDMRDYYR